MGRERWDVGPDATGGYVGEVIPAMLMHRGKVCGSERSERDPVEAAHQMITPPSTTPQD
ncbi:hypothetical protein [Streptomyces sp. NPDC058045]|uniref:hypothetical protein n=1 Tax=Streptomyces sp. NPDC058045 TaxID=3346311 RepID=UPI0036DFBE3F